MQTSIKSEPCATTGAKPASNFDGSQAVRDLARFRYGLRKFVRFSENAARECGVTPQQHQLMLGVAGFTGRNCATVSELAEFLQERNHSVVGLVERAVQSGLVRRAQDSADRRVVVVFLTRRGEAILKRLTKLHYEEVRAFPWVWPPGTPNQEGSTPSEELPSPGDLPAAVSKKARTPRRKEIGTK